MASLIPQPPKPPEMTPRNFVWAVAVAVAIYVATGLLYFVAHWLAVVPSVLLLIAAVWLIGGELLLGQDR